MLPSALWRPDLSFSLSVRSISGYNVAALPTIVCPSAAGIKLALPVPGSPSPPRTQYAYCVYTFRQISRDSSGCKGKLPSIDDWQVAINCPPKAIPFRFRYRRADVMMTHVMLTRTRDRQS